MLVCPDCRTPLNTSTLSCNSCSWQPIQNKLYLDFLSTRDRVSADQQSYADTYETLAERNLASPVESNAYVESLSVRLAELIGSLKGLDVCDVGVGRGYFVNQALQQSARSVTAVDIASKSLADVAQRYGVRSFLANAESLPFERAFDLLTATDILEHVLSTTCFLLCANWSLRDGGRLAVRVPYLENMLGYSRYFGLPMHYTHLRTYDRTTLVHTVENVGFKVEQIHYSGLRPDYMAPWLDRTPALREKLRAHLVKRYGNVDAGDAPFAKWIMKPIEITAVARKVEHIAPGNWHSGLREFYEKNSKTALLAPK